MVQVLFVLGGSVSSGILVLPLGLPADRGEPIQGDGLPAPIMMKTVNGGSENGGDVILYS